MKLRFALSFALVATLVVAEEHRRRREEHRGSPSQDIEVKFAAANNVARVVFSHERHFGALGGKHCNDCHKDELGLGAGQAFPSRAPTGVAEPHAAMSRGRFCANCHTGKGAAFAALGRIGDANCERCHVPIDHGTDFVRRHGSAAEHGAKRCEACHRGSTKITPAELKQVQTYREAQAALKLKPDDSKAAQAVMPNNFCAYCHAADQKPWRHED
jgi:c(7)-type cytochrome triheme protein